MNFQFNLQGEHLNSSKWAYDNGWIEGDFYIYIDGEILFEEPYMNVFELAIQLAKWLEDVRQGMLRHFEYDSIDCDDCLLAFYIEHDGVHVKAFEENFSPASLAMATVTAAVQTYLVELNIELHRIGYMDNLDRFLTDILSSNELALMLFEQNDYDAAFKLFKKLAYQQPSVQSLNNLAYMYLREEEDRVEARKWLMKALELKPKSAFPYMMLGEIALHDGAYKQAKINLQKALVFEEAEPAIYNLALAHFRLGEYAQAAEYFSRCAGDSDQTRLHEVVARLYAGERDKAKAMLANWNEQSDDYTGAMEIADVYIELGCFGEACVQFEKEWGTYISTPYIVSRYAYTLWHLRDEAACQALIQQAIMQTVEELEDEKQAEFDEHWSPQDQQERLLELDEQLQTYEQLLTKLKNGYVPAFKYDIYSEGGCQLFGCMRHGNREYGEELG